MKSFAYLAAFSLLSANPVVVAAQDGPPGGFPGDGMPPAPAAPATAAVVGSLGLKQLTVVAPVTPCEALRGADFTTIPGAPAQISSASTEIDASTGKPFCHVTGFVAPQVRFEMKLPANAWTQRLLMTGCGGLCGMIGMHVEHANDCLPARQGEMAIVATDMGHEGQGGVWADKDPVLRTDFAYRGVHVVALAAKAIVAKYYGQKQAYAYFSGCSDGGREALMEAQRFPDDFDGITAGAPAANFTVQNSFYHAWNAYSNTGADGQAILTTARLPVLHAAAVKACDKLDGTADGLIADPTRCHFDPATVQCAPGQATDACLTPAEVKAAREIYLGAHDDKGNRFVVGAPMPGSELAWQGVETPMMPGGRVGGAMFAEDSVKYLLHWPSLPASWRASDFVFDMANFQAMTANNALYGATDPDLSKFFGRGGRLIMWHGWSDQHISPINSIAYYRAVEATLGADATRQNMRFYLFPGMYHCGGGDGLNEVDVLTPVMAWVETGKAPEGLKAGHSDQGMPGAPPPIGAKGAMARTPGDNRLPQDAPAVDVARNATVPPYPMLADFAPVKGKVPKIANGYERFVPDHWAGDDLYKPYAHSVCEWNGNAYSCTPQG